jgi:hypothetical protein
MPRPRTARDDRKMRQVLDIVRGNLKELNRWARAVRKQSRPALGAPPINDGTFRLLMLEAALRVRLTNDPGIRRLTALRELVRELKIPTASSESSVVARLSRKLQNPKFQRMFEKKVTLKHYPRPEKSQI